MTDLRARAKELAEAINDDHAWCDDAHANCGIYREPVADMLACAFEAIRAEQIEADARIAENSNEWPQEGADIAANIRAQTR